MRPCSRRSSAEFNPRWLAGVSIVLLDGQYMPLCIAAAKAAHERGIPVVLDSGSWKPGMASCCRFARHRDLLGRLPAARLRQSKLTSSTILRAGRFDVWPSLAAALQLGLSKATQRGEISVPQIRPIDTLGAGDIFHGAFLLLRLIGPGSDFRGGHACLAASRVAVSRTHGIQGIRCVDAGSYQGTIRTPGENSCKSELTWCKITFAGCAPVSQVLPALSGQPEQLCCAS